MGKASRRKRERAEGDPPVEWTTFEAFVNAADGRPFVQMTSGLGDDPVFATKLSPAMATALGLRAIQAAIESERDAGFIAYLLEEVAVQMDIPEDTHKQFAAMMLDGLRRHRQQFDAPTGSMASLGDDDSSELTDDPPERPED